MPQTREPLDRNVVITGLTSFFTDISSEMIYPLLQAFVGSILKAQTALLGPVLGVIEGISEATASLLKVYSGYWSDRLEKRKMPTIWGYAISSLSRFLFFLPFWYTVLTARFFDRVGKGIRTAPRDALIAESTSGGHQGRAFGFQRAMDFSGAMLGTVFCYLLVGYVFPGVETRHDPQAFYPVFAVAMVPAFIGVACLFFIREKGRGERTPHPSAKPQLHFRHYHKSLRVFFLAQFIFTLGNSSNQFLLLRSTGLGYALSTVILMYIVFNLVTSLAATAFGGLSDRIGRKKLLVAGYGLYAVVYMAFGFIDPSSRFLLWIFWPVYGLYYAMTEGVEKAFVAEMAPAQSKATALGFFNMIVGIGLLPASVIAGLLFSLAPAAPFIFGGLTAVTSVVIICLSVTEKQRLEA